MLASFNRPALAFAASCLIFVGLLFVALLPVVPRGTGVEEDEIASRTIRAPRDISFVSAALTERRREEAAAAVPEVFVFDPSVAAAQQAELNALWSRIREAVKSLSPAIRRSNLDLVSNFGLTSSSTEVLVNLSAQVLSEADSEARRALAAILNQPISASFLPDVQLSAATYVDPRMDRETATLIAEIIQPFIVSTEAVDSVLTEADRQSAREAGEPITVSFTENQIIVSRDALITPEAREALIESGLVGDVFTRELIGASALLSVVAASVILAGLKAFQPAADARQLLLVGLAIAIPVFVIKVYLPLILPDEDRHFLAFILPVAVSSMVLAGFIGAGVALLAAAMIALLTAFVAVLLLDVTVVGLTGSLEIARLALVSGIAGAAGAFAVRNADRLARFLLGGLAVGVSIFAILSSTWLLDPNHQIDDFAWILLASATNGGLSAFISAGIFVTIGNFFGVTTRLQLLEMSQLSQPLLLRLQDEAPSTFQHSVMVANLAEKGAHLIGADSLVARVGCYYHDIGKLVRPGFFIENQMGGANPHDALDPEHSAQIISDHVNDGLALARQYKLPARIASFIPEHHGTRLVTYFYRQAAEQNPDLDQNAFRYPGPKPQTRETAISMLADSSEATVRSSPDRSPEQIDQLIDEVFSERLTEGQLDECDITLRDLRSLAESFKTTLIAVYHPRIEYPAPSVAEVLLRRRPFRRSQESD